MAESQIDQVGDPIRTMTDVKADRHALRRLGSNFKVFFVDAWLDIVVLVIIGVTVGCVWGAGPVSVRYFPITYLTSGDVVYPEISYPYVDPIFSATGVALLVIILPIFVILFAQIWIRSFFDAANGILGLVYSILTGTLFQVVLKKTVGGLRPHFLAVCEPRSSTELVGLGTGFGGIMYTAEQACTGSRSRIRNALESFPSGHSEIAFATMFYLAIYLFAHLRIQGPRRPSLWKMSFIFAPLLLATYIAGSVVLCYHHHAYDAVFGSLIGILTAIFGYRMCFRSVADSRWNCVPSRRGQAEQDPIEAEMEQERQIGKRGLAQTIAV